MLFLALHCVMSSSEESLYSFLLLILLTTLGGSHTYVGTIFCFNSEHVCFHNSFFRDEHGLQAPIMKESPENLLVNYAEERDKYLNKQFELSLSHFDEGTIFNVKSQKISTHPIIQEVCDHHKRKSSCMFARAIYGNPRKYGLWFSVIATEPQGDISDKDIYMMDTTLTEAFKNGKCQSISLLFPNVSNTMSLINVVNTLRNRLGFRVEMRDNIERDVEYGMLTGLLLRKQIPGTNVDSWALASGHFPYFPETRQSPIFEITLRTKERHKLVPPELSNARPWEAHVADIPFQYTQKKNFSRLWEGTYKLKREKLKHPNDRRAKAGVTLVIPSIYLLR